MTTVLFPPEAALMRNTQQAMQMMQPQMLPMMIATRMPTAMEAASSTALL